MRIRLDVANPQLQVPQGPRLPMQGAGLQPIPLGAVGGASDAVERLGSTLMQLAERATSAREQRDMMTAGADYAEGLADLHERMRRNDPAFSGDAVGAYRTSAAQLAEQIGARLPEGMREAWTARSRGMVASTYPGVLALHGQQQAEQTQGALADTSARLSRLAAAETNPALRTQHVEQFGQAVTDAQGAGAISPVQAQRMRAGFAANLDQADGLRMMQTDPGGLARRLTAEPDFLPNLDPVQRERLAMSAQSHADTLATRAEARQRQDEARRERAIEVEVRDVNGLLSQGLVPEDRVQRLLTMAQGTQHEPAVRQMVESGRTIQRFVAADAEQQGRMLSETDARRRSPNATDADQALYARLVQVRDAQVRGYREDGVGRAVQEGLIPPLPALNWADPSTLNARVSAAQGVSGRVGFAVSPFTRDDLAAGVEAFQRGGVEQRLAMVQSLTGISDPAIRTAAIQHFERARGDAGRLPAGTMVRIADMLRGGSVVEAQAARRLMGDLGADVSDRARQIGEGAELRSALVDAQGSAVQGVRARQASIAGGGAYAALVNRDMDIVHRSAAVRMASGESSATRAVQAAQRDLNAGLAVVDDTSVGHVYFPAAQGTPEQVRAGMRLLRDQAAATPTDPRLGAEQAQQAIARREASRRAVWINEGSTFALVGQGEAGAPVVLRTASLREITDAALAGSATPPQRAPVLREGEAAPPVDNLAIVRRVAGPDADLAAAIAREENGGRTAGISPAGALGLMQIMPDTARQMATRAGLPYDAGRLNTDPEYNARLGVEYIRHLREQPHLRGDPTLIAAAYNAGPERVRRWLDAGTGDLPAETVAYVGRVLARDPRQGPALLAAARGQRQAGAPVVR